MSKALCISLLILMGLSGPAASPPLPLDEYWQVVRETQELIGEMIATPSAADSGARLRSAADRWEGITAVVLPDGTQVPVDHSYVVSQLRADPVDLARLDALLDALLAGSSTWPVLQPATFDARELERILARPEFQWQPERPSPLAEWWSRLWLRLLEFLADLLPEGGAIGLTGDTLRWLITALGTLALAVILASVARSLLTSLVTEAEFDAADEREGVPLTAASALKRAQALSDSGDRRLAVRYLYLSALLILEERGLLRYDRSLTNREYLRSVAHEPHLAVLLGRVVEVFDRVWYGYQPLDDAAYEQYAGQVTDLRQQR